jgi:hypothetical protein
LIAFVFCFVAAHRGEWTHVYYNDYDFLRSHGKKKVRRDASASAPPGCISFKKAFLFFVVLECFSEKPARALATAIGMKLVIGKGREGKRNGNGKGKGTGVPRIFLWRKNLYNFGMILDAEWQDVAKGAGTSVLCPSCRSRRESVGVLLDWATPRDRICACTDSGSLTTWKTHMMS